MIYHEVILEYKIFCDVMKYNAELQFVKIQTDRFWQAMDMQSHTLWKENQELIKEKMKIKMSNIEPK